MKCALFAAVACLLAVHSAATARAAGSSLTIELPRDSTIRSAVAVAPVLKLQSEGVADRHRVVFSNLLPNIAYDVRIALADGTILQGVDLSWYGPEPAKPNAGPLDEEDRKQIDEQVAGIKAFENKRRLLAIRGDHDRAVLLMELIRDTPFYGRKGDEVIWRIELWYFKNQHGGWERIGQQNKVLRRERFPSQRDFQSQVRQIRWLPELGDIRLGKDESRLIPLVLPTEREN